MRDQITVLHNPSDEQLTQLDVSSWAIWEKEASEYHWLYEEKEVCYLLDGVVQVTPDDGQPVSFGAGDLVTFEEGLSCTWKILEPVRKHYVLGEAADKLPATG
ncbi:MAG: cupin domain-containing protein [Chloroflexi bacterium]|nr:cupin domain-containing protein [Chloroflexota bacterium]